MPAAMANASLMETWYPIQVPPGSTVDSAAKPFWGSRLTVRCEAELTEANFGTPKTGPIQAGFYDMGKDWKSEEGRAAVVRLAELSGRKLRLGTPEEALLFISQNPTQPEAFAVLGKEHNGQVIYWMPDHPRFHINSSSLGWGELHRVFLVEELGEKA